MLLGSRWADVDYESAWLDCCYRSCVIHSCGGNDCRIAFAVNVPVRFRQLHIGSLARLRSVLRWRAQGPRCVNLSFEARALRRHWRTTCAHRIKCRRARPLAQSRDFAAAAHLCWRAARMQPCRRVICCSGVRARRWNWCCWPTYVHRCCGCRRQQHDRTCSDLPCRDKPVREHSLTCERLPATPVSLVAVPRPAAAGHCCTSWSHAAAAALACACWARQRQGLTPRT